VEQACSCVVADDLRDRVIDPGQQCPLAVQIHFPESGVRAQKLVVVHDGEGPPVTLAIEAVGRRKPPYVLGRFPNQVTFFELSSTAVSERMRVTTCEPAEAPPWLGAMTSDLQGLTADQTLVGERRSGAVVVREYEYRIGWRRMPAGLEFSGVLQVQT